MNESLTSMHDILQYKNLIFNSLSAKKTFQLWSKSKEVSSECPSLKIFVGHTDWIKEDFEIQMSGSSEKFSFRNKSNFLYQALLMQMKFSSISIKWTNKVSNLTYVIKVGLRLCMKNSRSCFKFFVSRELDLWTFNVRRCQIDTLKNYFHS